MRVSQDKSLCFFVWLCLSIFQWSFVYGYVVMMLNVIRSDITIKNLTHYCLNEFLQHEKQLVFLLVILQINVKNIHNSSSCFIESWSRNICTRFYPSKLRLKNYLEEYHSLMVNDTWDLVPLPKGRKIVKCKWVYRPKYALDGSVERLKEILVSKFFSEVEGIDYNETFAPVAKMNSIFLVLSLASLHKYEVHQMDVKYAFLLGNF